MSSFLLRNVCGPRFTLPSPAWSIWQTAPLSLTSQWGADCHEKEHEENDRDVDQDGGVYDDEEDGEDPSSCLLLLVVVVDEEVHGDKKMMMMVMIRDVRNLQLVIMMIMIMLVFKNSC